MHRTGVVSQRLVLQVEHMEQLVAETCRCDLSRSVSRPLDEADSDFVVMSNIMALMAFFSLGLH